MGSSEGLVDEDMVARRLELGHSLAAGGHLGAPSAARAAKIKAKAQASPQKRVLARALSMGACGAAGANKGSDSPTSPRGFPESPEGSPLGAVSYTHLPLPTKRIV